MDVAGAVINRANNDLSYDPNDGGILVLISEPVEHVVQRLGGLLVFFFEDFVDRFADGIAGGIVQFEAVEDVALGGCDNLKAKTADLLQSIDGVNVERISDGHSPRAVVACDGHREAAPGDLLRDNGKCFLVDRNAMQIDRASTRLACQEIGQDLGCHQPKLDKDLGQSPAMTLLLAFGEIELNFGKHAG